MAYPRAKSVAADKLTNFPVTEWEHFGTVSERNGSLT